MASTFTDLLRFEKQADGENDSTWGSRVNTVFEMIEDAISKFTSVVMPADANYTLTVADSAADEARCMGLNVTSGVSLTATRDVVCPTSTKSYIVKNDTTGGQSIRIKTAAGTGVTIPNGKTAFILCDGTNVVMAMDWVNALAFGDASTTRTNLGVAIGSNVEAWDADLDALAALGSTGFAVRTAANTWAQRSLTAPAAGLTISQDDGVAGNPTLSLANDLSSLEGLGSTGIAVRTAADTWAQRAISSAGGITVTNGDGVAGNPSLSFAQDFTSILNSVPTTSGAVSVNHGLGVQPRLYTVSLVMGGVTELNYLVGDEVLVAAGGSATACQLSIGANTTAVFVAQNNAPFINNKSSGASTVITPSRWTYTIRAWK